MKKTNEYKTINRLLLIAFMAITIVTCKVTADAATGSITDVNGKQLDAITTHVVTSGTKSDANKLSEHRLSMAGSEKQAVFPLKLTKSGDYKYIVEAEETYGNNGYISTEIYSDRACTKRLSGVQATVFLKQETSHAGHVSIPKAGTYYLKLSASSSIIDSFETVKVKLKGHLFNADNRTLTDKKTTTTYTTENKYVYYKVNVKKTGYITVKQDYLVPDDAGYFKVKEEGASSYVALCDRKKKALTTDCYNNLTITRNKQVYAVKKGTYYLKVKSSATYPYRIKYTFKAFADQGGSSQKNAKSTKLGGKATGLIQATDKTTKVDWYKFYLPGKRNVTVSISGNTCNSIGSVRVQIVPPKNVVLFGSTFSASGTGFKNGAKSKDKFSKGTWYIKVTKTGDTVTGNYTLTVK